MGRRIQGSGMSGSTVLRPPSINILVPNYMTLTYAVGRKKIDLYISSVGREIENMNNFKVGLIMKRTVCF